MNWSRHAFAACVLVVFATVTFFPLADANAAGKRRRATYIVIGPSGRHAPPTHAPTRGYVRPTTRSGYAYGWFGAETRSHYTRHFGYFRGYTQWTRR